jgi:hypothetical protein
MGHLFRGAWVRSWRALDEEVYETDRVVLELVLWPLLSGFSYHPPAVRVIPFTPPVYMSSELKQITQLGNDM